MKKSIFLFFSGTAGAGKNTVIDNLIANDKDNCVFLNSHTSRARRPDDSKEGRYNYVSQEEFERLISEDKILEYDLVNGKYYGISKEEINRLSKENKVVLKDLTPKGVMNCKDIFKNKLSINGIFLTNTKKILKERLIERKFPKDQIKSRLKLYKSEQAQMKLYDYVIFNNNLQTTLTQCEAIIDSIQSNSKLFLGLSPQKISNKLIEKNIAKLNKGKSLHKITAFAYNNVLYLANNPNEYLAYLKTGKSFPIYLIDTPANFIDNQDHQQEWKKLIKMYS